MKSEKIEEVNTLPKTQGGTLQTYDFGDDAGAGMEDVAMEEQVVPILRILHYQCPEIVKNDAKFIQGAAPGMILNTATREVFDGDLGLDLIVCARDYHYGEWIPRDDNGGGGGYRGRHDSTEALVRKLKAEHGKFKPLPWVNAEDEGVELVETGQFYALYSVPDIAADVARRAIVSFTSSSLKTYQGAITRHNDVTFQQPGGKRAVGPAWLYRWRLRSMAQSKGTFNWFSWRLDPAGPSLRESIIANDDPDLYAMAREFHKQYAEGVVKYDPNAVDPGGSAKSGEDVPF